MDSICPSPNLHSDYSVAPRAVSPSPPLPGWCPSGGTAAPPSSSPQAPYAQRRGGSEQRGCSAPLVPACWRWFCPGRWGWVLSAHWSCPSASCPASEPRAPARCWRHCGPCLGCPWPPGQWLSAFGLRICRWRWHPGHHICRWARGHNGELARCSLRCVPAKGRKE